MVSVFSPVQTIEAAAPLKVNEPVWQLD